MKHLPTLLAASAVLLLAAPSPVHAERTDEGTMELGGCLYYDPDTSTGGHLDLGLQAGYFIVDGWLLGGELSLMDDDFLSRYGISAVLERDFELGSADTVTPFIPYVAGALGYVSADYKDSDSEVGMVLGLRGGMKLMLTGNIALDFSLRADFASGEVFYDDDGPSRTDFSVRLGFRTFFF